MPDSPPAQQEAWLLLDELARILEAQRSSGRDPEGFVAARRVAHNLKGAALTVGAQRIAEPCHALEDEFEALARSADPASTEQLERWLGVLAELERAVRDPALVELPAASRETARQLNRPTELEILVGEVEVDLHLYQLLKDPLLHILRNAVAHGIENAEERKASGKPRPGRVRLAARADGAFVLLSVSDDGKGIDPDGVVRQAVGSGCLSAAAATALSDAERRALVFRPGLSTAEVVSTVAGRGMGLYAVQRNIEELGGAVTISPTPELGGSTFEIRIPATVLSVKGLLVQSGCVNYALPLSDVTLVAAVAPTELEQSEGWQVFRDSEGRPTRVRWLAALLGYPTPRPSPRLHLVVLRRSGQALALVVDRVLGEQDFVTRPLPWNLDAGSGVNGALILPDGSVALSLDATALEKLLRSVRRLLC